MEYIKTHIRFLYECVINELRYNYFLNNNLDVSSETGAEPSLQATQMKLKRARLADNLNEKIAQRPGPMELVEKNILPVDSSLKQAIIGGNLVIRCCPLEEQSDVLLRAVFCCCTSVGQVNYPKVLDEDSGDALSPEQPASQDSQSSVPSPGEHKVLEMSSPGQASAALPSNILQVRCRYEYRSQVVLHVEFLNNPSSENCCKY